MYFNKHQHQKWAHKSCKPESHIDIIYYMGPADAISERDLENNKSMIHEKLRASPQKVTRPLMEFVAILG